jgi:hypothetical protein
MIPKEKAKELVYKMSLATDEYGYINTNVHRHKQCALMAVSEVIKQCWDYRDIDLQTSYDYWQEVKQEIINL